MLASPPPASWLHGSVPGLGEPGYDSWPGDSRDYGGGGPWIVGTWDPELRMYYTGTANAYPFNAVPRGNGKYDDVGATGLVFHTPARTAFFMPWMPFRVTSCTLSIGTTPKSGPIICTDHLHGGRQAVCRAGRRRRARLGLRKTTSWSTAA